MKIAATVGTVGAVALAAGLAWQVQAAKAKPPAPDAIFETNLTNDLDISSGEPQIAVDPLYPMNIAVAEMAAGSSDLPAYTRNPLMGGGGDVKPGINANRHMGRVQLSNDGGNTWRWIRPPVYDPFQASRPGGGDPMIAYGPDGTLYVAVCTGEPPKKGQKITLDMNQIRNGKMFIGASTDGGKTWTFPQQLETPRDRPWLKVDESTGTVYTASTGPFNPTTKVYNIAGPDAPMDRWITAWKPHLTGHSEPRRLGGPDFSGAGGSTLSAANGILAATFVLGQPGPFGGGAAPSAIPASLRNVVKPGTTECTRQKPCVFFQTSDDEGRTWKRHHVPFPASSGNIAHVAADGGRAGRYAVGTLGPGGTSIQVMVTDDSGETWSGPHVIPETAQGLNFKQWMDVGPSGVLGYFWKKQRDDVSTPMPAGRTMGLGQTWGAAFDVYAAISCDGGRTWEKPVRINAETSPSGPNGFDDLSYVALDRFNLHAVWGDKRNITKVKNVGDATGGLQAYYGRVPFAAVTKTQCGRDRVP